MIRSVRDAPLEANWDRLLADADEMNGVVHQSVGSSKNGELDELAIAFLERALWLIAKAPHG